MISEDFLSLLVCPETKQTLSIADQVLLDSVKLKVDEGTLNSLSGAKVEGPVTDVLIREDRKVIYVVRDGIPILLIEEGILTEVL